jgi:hypothetical protein
MKQKIYIFGVITTMVIFMGTLFKINHYAGAGILLFLGIVTLAWVFIPVALTNAYKGNKVKHNLPLYIVTYITCLLVFTAMLFKIQHWPYSGIMLLIALPFPYVVFLPVFLNSVSKDKTYNIYNVVFVLSLLALNSVFSVLLALNVSKSRVEDSYSVSRNYNHIEKVLGQLQDKVPQSGINLKIDEVIKIVNDYQDLILKGESSSREQWVSNQKSLWRPESGGIAANTLAAAGYAPIGGKLSKGLQDLFSELNNTRGYEEFAKVTPILFDYNFKTENVLDWGQRIFAYNNLSWTMIYLDGVKSNLCLIKASTQ